MISNVLLRLRRLFPSMSHPQRHVSLIILAGRIACALTYRHLFQTWTLLLRLPWFYNIRFQRGRHSIQYVLDKFLIHFLIFLCKILFFFSFLKCKILSPCVLIGRHIVMHIKRQDLLWLYIGKYRKYLLNFLCRRYVRCYWWWYSITNSVFYLTSFKQHMFSLGTKLFKQNGIICCSV